MRPASVNKARKLCLQLPVDQGSNPCRPIKTKVINMKRAFIIHAWDDKPEKNWYPWLKEKLQSHGFQVKVPAMPNPDEPVIADRITLYRSFDEFIASPTFGQRRDTSLHVGLLPIPFIGALGEASVFILMLNPGLAPGDYFAERIPEFRTAHLRNLRQENSHEEFPFFFLAPRFAWHPGFTYWQGKMHDIALALVKKEQISYQERC